MAIKSWASCCCNSTTLCKPYCYYILRSFFIVHRHTKQKKKKYSICMRRIFWFKIHISQWILQSIYRNPYMRKCVTYAALFFGLLFHFFYFVSFAYDVCVALYLFQYIHKLLTLLFAQTEWKKGFFLVIRCTLFTNGFGL